LQTYINASKIFIYVHQHIFGWIIVDGKDAADLHAYVQNIYIYMYTNVHMDGYESIKKIAQTYIHACKIFVCLCTHIRMDVYLYMYIRICLDIFT